MHAQQIVLLVLNVIGGAAVIGSYIYGLSGQGGGANVLWGGVPTGIRPVYTVSMIISALGYFAFLYFLLFRLAPEGLVIGGNFGYGIFFGIFLLILLPSALWMPLTNFYVGDPAAGTWFMVRTVLALVALGSVFLTWALLSLPLREGVAYWLAVAGAGYFIFHTGVLDAIIWAALFK
ncbi:MAG: hypothetical protein JXA46_07140 [Dehalococcoidales bacterium]|nr:hypothetical protein [Dehalococcoidales bacterium]